MILFKSEMKHCFPSTSYEDNINVMLKMLPLQARIEIAASFYVWLVYGVQTHCVKFDVYVVFQGQPKSLRFVMTP